MVKGLRVLVRFGGLVPGIGCLLLVACSGWEARKAPGVDQVTREKRSNPLTGASSPENGPDDETGLSAGGLQIEVMDFADEYVTAVGAVIDEFVRSQPDAPRRVAALSWKARYSAAAMTIAASRDPRTNVLDMVVFMTAGRWAMDHYWVPEVFGEEARPLSEVYRVMEERAWTLAGQVLSMQQQSELHQLVRNWERENPRARDVADIRLRNLDGVRLSAFDDGLTAQGIRASVRRFLGRVDNSLLYGERVMFYLERTPRILSHQTELTLAQIGEAFPIASVRPAEVAGAVAALPGALQAAIDENEGSLNVLLPQFGTLLDRAGTLALSLDSSLLTVRELAAKASDSPLLNADPALLLERTSQALAHLDSSVSGLNQLLAENATGESKTAELTRRVDAAGERLLDAAFQRALILLGVIFSGTAFLLVLTRLLFGRRGKAANPTSGG